MGFAFVKLIQRFVHGGGAGGELPFLGNGRSLQGLEGGAAAGDTEDQEGAAHQSQSLFLNTRYSRYIVTTISPSA